MTWAASMGSAPSTPRPRSRCSTPSGSGASSGCSSRSPPPALTSTSSAHGIEKLHPVEYLAGRYYEHWLHTIEDGLVSKGVIDEHELEERTRQYLENPDAPLPEGGDPEQAEQFVQLYRTGASTRRETDAQPRFKVGDRVRVRNLNPTGHTRCARYLRGKEGVVERVYDAFVFPDTNAKEDGEDPQPVYNVRFDAAHVWGGGHDGERHMIRFDLWEPYLEAA